MVFYPCGILLVWVPLETRIRFAKQKPSPVHWPCVVGVIVCGIVFIALYHLFNVYNIMPNLVKVKSKTGNIMEVDQSEVDGLLAAGYTLETPAPEAGEKAAAIAAMEKAIEQAKVIRASGTSAVTSKEFWGITTQREATSKGQTEVKKGKNNKYTALYLSAVGDDGQTVNLRGLLPLNKPAEQLIKGAILTIEQGDETTTGNGYLFNIV